MRKRERALRLLPPLAMLFILLFFGATLRRVSLEDILSLAPDSYPLCILLFLGLYALKSLSIVFPLMVLYVSAGALLPLPLALLASTAGLFICITLPFFIGRFSGKGAVDRLLAKYPKAAHLSEYSTENATLCAYFLRIINLLPGDLVSMVLGAAGLSFWQYAAGSLLGLLPVMVPAVVMGRNLDSPLSARFLLPVAVIALVSLFSMLLVARRQKRQKQGRGPGGA